MDVRAAVGRYGERVAVAHLERSGLVVLARNWRCREGEIDVVARDGDELVVVEVKTRRPGPEGVPGAGSPLEAVTPAKAARLRRLGWRWLAAHPAAHPAGVRVDVVGVLRPRSGAAVVEHVRGVA